MGLLSHRVERSEIVGGDHIYSWRAVFAYSHHGIYVGGGKVVHFTCEQNMGSSGDSFLSFSNLASSSIPSISASSLGVASTCKMAEDCGFRQPKSGVVLSCLDCFLGRGSLYRFEYGVAPLAFHTKIRGGCTIAKSDSQEAVIRRAMYLLQNGFGKYNVVGNNCEDFALYCKTGLLILDKTAPGRSGQAVCAISAPLAVLLSASLRLFMSSPVGVVTASVGMYCMNRYSTDIGVRSDAFKVPVGNMALFHGREGPEEEFDEGNDRCEKQNKLIGNDNPPAKT